MSEVSMSEETKIGNVNEAASDAEPTGLNSNKETMDDLAESADGESVQLRVARKIMREYSETLKRLADS
jgi:hypothetical protein